MRSGYFVCAVNSAHQRSWLSFYCCNEKDRLRLGDPPLYKAGAKGKLMWGDNLWSHSRHMTADSSKQYTLPSACSQRSQTALTMVAQHVEATQRHKEHASLVICSLINEQCSHLLRSMRLERAAQTDPAQPVVLGRSLYMHVMHVRHVVTQT